MVNIRRFYKEEDSVINTDSFDRERFAKLTELSPKLGELVEKQMKENRDFPSLMGDLWASLYKMKPTMKEFEEGEQPKRQMNHQLMDRVFADEQFEQMRKATTLDDFSSAIGSMRMNEKVYEWLAEQKSKNEALKELMQRLIEKQKQMESQQQKQEKVQQRQQDAQDSGDNAEQKKADSQAKREQKKMDSIQQELSDIQNQIQQQISQAMQGDGGSSFSRAIQSASAETQESKEDLQNLLAGGAGASSGEGEMKKIPLRDQIALAETLRQNKKLREIAEWAGNFKSIARKKQKSKHTESLDRSGMTLGDDVERLLPQELGMMLKETTKIDFLRRFAEGQTMMYSPKGKETLGKGPIIICLDQSGSMQQLDSQSKGFVLALAMIAKKQRRDFVVIPFSNRVEHEFFYEKGKITPVELVTLAKTFQGGGTHYGAPLEKAKNIILNQKRFKKADILFVTDGDPHDTGLLQGEQWQGDFQKFKKDTDTNVLSLLIGSGVRDYYVSLFSDKVIHANDFQDENSHDILAI